MSTTEIPAADIEAVRPRPKQDGGRSGARRACYALAMRLHFYAGVFVAPFILIAAVTGALYAIAPTLESVVNRDLLHTDSTGSAQPLANQITAAVGTEPNLALASVMPAQHTGDTTRVIFTDPSLGESERRAVFVDPVTARPLGNSVVYGSSSSLPLRTWIDQLHRNLHLGEPGRLYSELAASWLWVIALAGALLWIRRVAARREGFSMRRLVWAVQRPRSRRQMGPLSFRRVFGRNPLGPGQIHAETTRGGDRSSAPSSEPMRTRRGGDRPRTLNWHATVGIWVLLPVLFLSATGMTWSTYAGAHVDKLRAELSWTAPAVDGKLPGMDGMPMGGSSMPMGDHEQHDAPSPAATSTPVERIQQVDKVFEVARAHRLAGPVEITFPADAHKGFTVKERRVSGTLTQDAIAVDGNTGNVTDTVRYADWPLMAKLANWGIQLHMGMMFGLANQLLLLATMIALITVIVRGYLMWWRRRPVGTGSRRAFGAPPRRGSLLRLPVAIGIPLVATTALLGWFAPLLGLSLLAFLVVDVLVGAFQRRRSTA